MSIATTPQPLAPAAPTLRTIGDVTATRQAIFDRALQAASALPPLSNQQYTLQLGEVGYEGPEQFSKDEEKRAIIEGRSLGRRLRGTWQLMQPDGTVVDTRRVTLGTIPYLTDRGTYVFRGNDYSLAHQPRLRPGVFTRVKDSGELESHINVAKGYGHRYYMDPATGVFRMQMGQSRVPLLPVLKALGATDTQIRKAWGNDLYAANVQKSDTATLKKVYQKLKRSEAVPADAKAINEVIQAAFAEMELDPEVTQRTLGKPYSKVDPESILATTGKLIRVHRGEDEPDDRDSMVFQRLMGPEDVIAERISKSRQELQKLLWKTTFAGNLQRLPANVLEKRIRGALLETGLGSPLEDVNPAEVLDQLYRATRMGEGGIASSDAVPMESRNVQPSHLGFIDPIHTPESGKIGVDTRLSVRTRKDDTGKIYTQFRNTRTGELEWKSPQDLADVPVAFPGEFDRDVPRIRTLWKGKLRYAPRDKVAYELPDMTRTFGPLANMVPMKLNVFPQRVAMGARMLTQALPLVGGEAPLVQAGIPGEEQSFEELYGTQMGAVRSDVGGTVQEITPGAVTIKGTDGESHVYQLHDNRPNNRKTLLHNTPLVQVGQQVQPGDLLARSNFTDERGTTALGRNLRVAYIPYRGYNFEDAMVISASAAKKLRSEHAYQHDLDLDDDVTADKAKFVASFPGKYSKKLLDQFDASGIIKPGTEVQYEDPLILAVQQRKAGPRLGRRKRSFADATVTWDHHAPGVVTDVYRGKKGINVIVKSTQEAEQGDKVSNRYGNKGIIAKIVPDDEMPQDGEGRPFEVLLNPLGIISRGNPVQILEAALGKIAEKTGKPYKVPDFGTPGEMLQWVEGELRKHGLPDVEELFDPGDNRRIKDVFTGNTFLMKLHHTADAKLQGRDIGSYTAEDQPAKGGPTGAKRLGMLDSNAILSHGAFSVLQDAGVVRGQRNEDLWRQVMSGYDPPQPQVPFVYRKFVNELKAAGINPIREGTRTNLMAMTNADVDQLAGNREIKNVETVDWKSQRLDPVKGGLFDKSLTGGHGGDRWTAIPLHHPLPNPVMEEPIRRLLGLTQKEYREVLAGKREHHGCHGPKCLSQALSRINVDKEMDRARQEIRSGRKTYRDAAVKRLAYLKTLKRTGMHPQDWMLSRLPVLPPVYRPVSLISQNNTPLIADPNFLYKEVFEANQALADLDGRVDDVSDERLAVYDAVKAVTGLGDPIRQEHREQRVRGILSRITGSSPKHGMVQRKLLGSVTDLVGRATVAPDPNLDMDQVGLPVEKAWTIYRPFVVRRLVRRGMPRMRALQQVQDRSPAALQELQQEMQARPVLINRAPVLHRYGVMAAWPQLTRGDTLRVPPLIVGGMGMDFDGDAAQFHVPATDDAVEEAIAKMMPSKNLLSVGQFDVHYLPSQEYVGGLWEASTAKDEKRPVRTFKSKAAAIKAYRRGEIGHGQRIRIMDG